MLPLVVKSQQRTLKNSLTLMAGVSQNMTNDALINYFTYKGKNFSPIVLNYQRENSRYILKTEAQLSWYHSELTPNNSYYMHNQLNSRYFDLTAELLRKNQYFENKFTVAYGILWQSNMFIDKQNYNSLLSSNGDKFRKSFDATLASLGLGIQVAYQISSKNKIILNAFYAPNALLARPDNNTVKQLTDATGKTQYQFQIGNYIAYRINFEYAYRFSEWYELLLQLSQSYQHHLFMAPTTHKNTALLIGLKRNF